MRWPDLAMLTQLEVITDGMQSKLIDGWTAGGRRAFNSLF